MSWASFAICFSNEACRSSDHSCNQEAFKLGQLNFAQMRFGANELNPSIWSVASFANLRLDALTSIGVHLWHVKHNKLA